MSAQGEKSVYEQRLAIGKFCLAVNDLGTIWITRTKRVGRVRKCLRDDRARCGGKCKCVGMIFAAATTSKTVRGEGGGGFAAAPAGRLRDSDGPRRRPRYRNHDRARHYRLGAGHRPEHSDRRRRDRAAAATHHEQPYRARAAAHDTQGARKTTVGEFVAAVIGNTEDTWKEIYQEAGSTYRRAARCSCSPA